MAATAQSATTPSALLWDMDGTLVDTEPYWEEALGALAGELQVTLTEATRESLLGAAMPTSVKTVFALTDLELTPARYGWARGLLTEEVAQRFRAHIPWRPGARQALTLAAELGIPQALVTATERDLVNIALTTFGDATFAASVTGDEVVNGKPAADPYLQGARLLERNSAACLAIEDSVNGSQSASAAGCSVLVVPSFVPVPAGPKRVFRPSLEGLTGAELTELWEHSLGR